MSGLREVLSGSILVFLSTATPAALVDNGGGLVYDTVLDITWAQPDEVIDWGWTANARAAGLTLGGVSGWRLPYISLAAGSFTGSPVDCSTATEVACRDNELGYMFYQNLSRTFGQSILDSGDPDLALFPGLGSNPYWPGYWSSTLFDSSYEWYVDFRDGSQDYTFRENYRYLWPVHAGNVGAVPVPSAALLLGSGLLSLIGIARRKKTA